jgi:voltage-gated potassium channel
MADAATALLPRTPRDRFNTFVVRHDVAWELVMAGLALLYVAVGFLNDQTESASLDVIEIGLTVVFAVEFLVRFAAAHDRIRYLRGHWIDVVALAPPVRGLRALRLLRLLRLVRMFAGVYRAGMHVQGIANHRGFAWLVVAWLSVMAICSIALYALEHGVNNTVNSPFDALWWGVVTLTSVGYGDVVPQTPEGRLVAMVLMLLGIGLFSAITATITSYLISLDRHDRPGLLDDLERLANLREQGSLSDDEFTAAKARVMAR